MRVPLRRSRCCALADSRCGDWKTVSPSGAPPDCPFLPEAPSARLAIGLRQALRMQRIPDKKTGGAAPIPDDKSPSSSSVFSPSAYLRQDRGCTRAARRRLRPSYVLLLRLISDPCFARVLTATLAKQKPERLSITHQLLQAMQVDRRQYFSIGAK